MTHRKQTVCVLCSNNCGLTVDIDDNKITKFSADKNNPFSNGYSCNKAYRNGYYINHEQRLTQPLKRCKDGSHKEISWDQAIAEIGAQLRNIHKQHGNNSIAVVGLGGQGNHSGVPYGLSTLIGFGSQWWFNALAQEKTQRSLVDGLMCKYPSDTMLVGHLEESDYAVIIGSNSIISNRGPEAGKVINQFKKSKDRKLVVIDPRKTETSRKADHHIAVQVGTDTYLLLGFIALLLQEKLYDREFVESNTTGINDIINTFSNIDPVDMADRCGIKADELRILVREFAAANRAVIEIDLGLEQSLFNTLTTYLIHLIMVLTDNYGRVGGAVFVGTLVPRIPRFLQSLGKTPVAPVSGIPGISLFAPLPMFSPSLFAEEVLRDDPGRIRAAIIEGSNPILSYPESPQTRKAFKKLELSVVIDVAMTESAMMADYVLPTPVGYEKWEYSTFPKPFPLLGVQIREPAVSGPENALPEAEIYYRISRAAKLTVPAPKLLHKLAAKADRSSWALVYQVMLCLLGFLWARSLKKTVPMVLFWLYETLGPTLRAPQLAAFWFICHSFAFTRRKDVLRAFPHLSGIRNTPAKLGNFLYQKSMDNPGGAILAKVDPEKCLEDSIGYSDGRIRLAPEAMQKEVKRALDTSVKTDPDYPFILNGGMRTPWTALTNLRDPKWRRGSGPHCTVRMNTDDADQLNLFNGDSVKVESRKGAVELPVKIEAQVQKGHIHIPNGFGTKYPNPDTGKLEQTGICINELTDAQDRDPLTGCPHFKYVRCRISVV